MSQPQPNAGNGPEGTGGPEAPLNRGPAFVPLSQTVRASEFSPEPTPPEAPAPKPRKPGLLDKFRARGKARPGPVASDVDDDQAGTASDPEASLEPDLEADEPGPARSPILSGRRARAAAAVGLSVVVLAGALAYPRLFPRHVKTEPETGSEEGEGSDESPAAGETRPPVVVAIPTGRVERPTAPADDLSTLPDPTTIVPTTPTPSGVRLVSANQPEPLDEPAPLPAGTGGLPADEPIPLPADALTPSGVGQARNRRDEPPPLDMPAPSELPPPVEAPSTVLAPPPVQQPPSLLDDPAPTPTPAVPVARVNPPPTAPAPAAEPAPSSFPAADTGDFVAIPNTRKARGAAAGSLAMATIGDGPSSRVRPPIDPRSTVEAVVPESVEPILHRVGSGQNFQTISKYYYGTTRYWKALWSANRALVPAPELLAVGMTIKVPMADELDARYVGPEAPAVETAPTAATEPTTIRSTPRTGRVVQSRFDPANDPPRRVGKPTYTVRRNGETLRSIARDVLGDTSRAQEILDLNAERLDGSPALKVGTTLRLPDDARPDQP